MRWTAAELVGVLLIGVALTQLHWAFAAAWFGLYLVVTAIVAQWFEPPKPVKKGEADGEKGSG